MTDPRQQLVLKQKLMQLSQAGRFKEAEILALSLVEQLPKDMELWFALGQLKRANGKPEEAFLAFQNAVARKSPVFERAAEEFLHYCYELSQYEQGYKLSKKLVKLYPSSAQSNFKAGFFAWKLSKESEAYFHLKKAVMLAPENSQFQSSFADSLSHLGLIKEASEHYAKAYALEPSDYKARFKDIYIQNYLMEISEQALFEKHVALGKLLEQNTTEHVFGRVATDRKIKIGYVSKDFNFHAVASFFLPLVRAHDKSKVDIYCYSDVLTPDEMTNKIRTASTHWRDSSRLNDDELHKLIVADGIDIIIDITGYSGGSRMPVFAKRAAPIQVNFLGYPNTSGLMRMDYRITDNFSDPKNETDQFFTEQLIRLEDSFLSYQPLMERQNLPSIAPKRNEDEIVFGSFNTFPKIQKPVMAAWASILSELPESKLLIKAKLFAESEYQRNTIRFFEKRGIKKNRLILVAKTNSYEEHLELFNRIDLHLDTHPYNGTTTTCDALSMGVPTICIEGNSHRSRIGASIIRQQGLTQYIASDLEEYVSKAISKGSTIMKSGLDKLTIQDTFFNSPTCDAALLAMNLETAFEKMIHSHNTKYGQSPEN